MTNSAHYIILHYISNAVLMHAKKEVSNYMKLSHDSIKPIYIQIAEGIEDDILDDILIENKQAYSQYQIAKQFNINPATAAKGINLLVHEGILYKKRGMGMHVSEGAKEMIQVKKRKKENFYSTMLKKSLLIEAKKIGISKEEILDRINQMIDVQ